MTREDIIRIAKNEYGIYAFTAKTLEHFIDLVAAAERERLEVNVIHTCHPECPRPVCVSIREAVAHEREQCAKVCEEIENQRINSSSLSGMVFGSSAEECAAAIRARGQS